MPTQIGIIGAGGMGATHARAWARLPEVKITGIVDTNLAKAQALAEKYQTAAYDSIEAMLSDKSLAIDCLSVCTPTYLHREHTEKALAAGCDVFCEKPLALSVSDCDAMIAAAEKAKKSLGVGQVVRFFPEFASAKRLVDSGAVGKPAVVRTRRGGGFPRCDTDWFNDASKSGGIIFDLAIHDIDWLLWTFGPIMRVYAKGITLENRDFCDYALLTFRHESGAVSHTEVTWADPKGGNNRFEIAGDAGLLSYESLKARTLHFRTETRVSSSGPLNENEDPYHRQIEAFHQKSPLSVLATEARAAVRVAEAAHESLKTGRAITL
jgi:UDP-N-acetylglucosamine 3-dehydrogenase